MVLTALDAGLHVLVDKPMVTRVADAYGLCSGRWSGRASCWRISFQAPYTFNYAHLAAARDRGELGTIRAANGWISQNWLELTRNTWRLDPALSGGGFIYDTGAHLLNGSAVAGERTGGRRGGRAGQRRQRRST